MLIEESGTRALLSTVDVDVEEEARVAIWLMTTSIGSMEMPRVAVMGAVVDDAVVDDELSMDMSLIDAPVADCCAVDLDPLVFRRKIALAFSFDSLFVCFRSDIHHSLTHATTTKECGYDIYEEEGKWSENMKITKRREHRKRTQKRLTCRGVATFCWAIKDGQWLRNPAGRAWFREERQQCG